MRAGEIRPHFDVHVEVSGQAALSRIARHLTRQRGELTGWVHPPYAELAVVVRDRHWWSPRLAVHVQSETEHDSTLHCRFQPEPGLWTLYMACWAMLIVGTMLIVGFGCAQVMMHRSPTVCLYGLPLAATTALSLYAIALFGQRLGAVALERLSAELHRAIETP